MESQVFRTNLIISENITINNCVFSLIWLRLTSVLDINKGAVELTQSFFHNCKTMGEYSPIVKINKNAYIVINSTSFDSQEQQYCTIISDNNQNMNNTFCSFKFTETKIHPIYGNCHFFSSNFSNFKGNFLVMLPKDQKSYFNHSFFYSITATKISNSMSIVERSIVFSCSFVTYANMIFNQCYLPIQFKNISYDENNIFYSKYSEIPIDFYPESVSVSNIKDDVIINEHKINNCLLLSDANNVIITNSQFFNIKSYSIKLYNTVHYFEMVNCAFDGCSGIINFHALKDVCSLKMNQLCCQNSNSNEGFMEIVCEDVEINNTESALASYVIYGSEISAIDITPFSSIFKNLNFSCSYGISQKMLKIYSTDSLHFSSSIFYNVSMDADELIFIDSKNILTQDLLFRNITVPTAIGTTNKIRVIRCYFFEMRSNALISFVFEPYFIEFIDCVTDRDLKLNTSGISIMKPFIPPFVENFENSCFIPKSNPSLFWVYIATGISAIILLSVCTFFIIKCAHDRNVIKNRMLLSSLVVTDFG